MFIPGNNYLCALDIGSSKLAACVAAVSRRQIIRVSYAVSPSRGIREGVIVDSIDLAAAIGKLLKELKAKSGIGIKTVHAGISGKDIVTKHSRAIIPLAERGNKVITVSDVRRAHEQARILGSSLEDEIIHMIPAGYTIDSKSSIANPVGLYSHRLEVDLYLICAKTAGLQTLGRIINQSGYELRDVCLSGLAASEAVFSPDHRRGTTIVCDIGGDLTEILIFSDGRLCEVEVVACGGNDLTAELSAQLKIPPDLADEIKRSYGVIGAADQISPEKEILIKKSADYKPIKAKQVSEVVTAKARAVCAAIREKVVQKIPAHQIAHFVIVGRSVLLEGFIETLESILGLPVKIGRLANPRILSVVKEDTALSGQNYVGYLTAMGIICDALEEKSNIPLSPSESPRNPVIKIVSRFREVYQEYF